MRELIAWSPDLATLKKAANATGFVDKVVDPKTKAVISESIKTTGTWTGSKGGWALNVAGVHREPTGKLIDQTVGEQTIQVPEMVPVPGVWARLRWNDEALLDRLNTFVAAIKAQGVTVYSRVNIGKPDAPEFVWSADGGKTSAPAYLDNIGQML
jgi:hypothetical protein